MYNLLIAGGVALVAYGAGFWAAGWIAGFVPAVFAFAGAWFLLGRRTGKQVEGMFRTAMEQLQAGNMNGAREALRAALPFGKWQVMLDGQIHGQLGAIDYLEACSLMMQKQVTASKAKFTEAKVELAQGVDWRTRTMLACVYHRENNTDEATKVLAEVEVGRGASRWIPGQNGQNEVMFWAVWAYILNEAKRRDEALQVVGRGLVANPKHAGLVAVQEAMSNRKRPDFKVFGEAWYHFFPEQIPQEVLIEQARAAGKLPKEAANRSRMTYPMPRR